MRLALQPLVDALRQHVGGGFASGFHAAVLTAAPSTSDLHDHATGAALLTALLGREPETALPLVRTYVVHAGQWVGLEPAELAVHHTAADLPTSLADALAAAVCAGAQAHFRDDGHIIDTVAVTEAEGLSAGTVHLKLVAPSGLAPLALAFGAPGLTLPLSRTTTISGAALRAAGEQARQHTDGGLIGLLNDIQLAGPAASGAIN